MIIFQYVVQSLILDKAVNYACLVSTAACTLAVQPVCRRTAATPLYGVSHCLTHISQAYWGREAPALYINQPP